MGWALLPTKWFNEEYKRHLEDTQTYQLVKDFDISQHITDSNKLILKLKNRFHKHLTSEKASLLNPVHPQQVQLPYMKLLPKVHKLPSSAFPELLSKLTGRSIITAHSWTTSNISKLLCTELDNIISQFKELFSSHNIPFPLIYNSSELTDKLEQQHIDDFNNFHLTTFDFSSLYTNITHQDTNNAIISSCKLLQLTNFYRDFLLNLNNFINNFFTIGKLTYKQIRGVAMGSYHSRQIADLVLLLREFYFFTNTHTKPHIFSHYIDDGFMLTDKTQTSQLITNLLSFYPNQIPITFTSNHHTVHYLDLTISLNQYTLFHNKIHYQIYQKPNHKYMYPHYSSNHPQHIFKGIVKAETIRYSRLSSTLNDYRFIHKLFSLRLTSLDYPPSLIQKHSFPFLSYLKHKRRTKRLNTTNKRYKPFIHYKTKYNKHIKTDKIVKQKLNKYHNKHIPKLTKTYTNSTKLHTLLLTNKLLHNKLINNNN